MPALSSQGFTAIFSPGYFPFTPTFWVLWAAQGSNTLERNMVSFPGLLGSYSSRLLCSCICKTKLPACTQCHITPCQLCVDVLCKAKQAMQTAQSTLIQAWLHQHTGCLLPSSQMAGSPLPGKIPHQLAPTDGQFSQPISKTKPPPCQNSNQGPSPSESRSQVR